MEDERDGIQATVDALSVAIGRPILLDDPNLAPLAYSRQWGEIDDVRARSILSRRAPDAVRDALLAQGIDEATDVVHTSPDPDLDMDERVCLPVRAGGELIAYIWVLDPGGTLEEPKMEELRAGARRLAGQLGAHPSKASDRSVAISQLISDQATERSRAAAELRSEGVLMTGEVVLCLFESQREEVELAAIADQILRRLSVRMAIGGALAGAGALVVSVDDPVVRTVHEDGVARWMRMIAPVPIAAGQSAPASLEGLDAAYTQAGAALRVARSTPSEDGEDASWQRLGADSLVAQLPPSWRDQAPIRLLRLLENEPDLAATLAAFLDSAGDVKATAEAASLHRSGVYYRLRRIEELTGLSLHSGDDRLLAHLVIRAERLR